MDAGSNITHGNDQSLKTHTLKRPSNIRKSRVLKGDSENDPAKYPVIKAEANILDSTFGTPHKKVKLATSTVIEGKRFVDNLDHIGISDRKVSSINIPFESVPEKTITEQAESTDGIRKKTDAEPEPSPLNTTKSFQLDTQESLIRGVGTTLAYLQKSGNIIKIKSSASASTNNSNIKIEHFDEHGNKLTPKQAYKQLSHQFHGNKPTAAKKRPKKFMDKSQRKSKAAAKKIATKIFGME